MPFKRLYLLLFICASGQSLANVHIHGAGSLFIAQDNNEWLFHYALPSADVFGFEHQPENDKQRAIVLSRKHLLNDAKHLIQVPTGCSIQAHDVNFPFDDEDHNTPITGHDSHHDASNESGEAHEHSEAHEEKKASEHNDVEIAVTLKCKPDISNITLTLFNHIPSINSLNVVWATNAGQGSQTATIKTATVRI